MTKRGLVLIAISIFYFSIVSFVSAQNNSSLINVKIETCFPDYSCGQWSKCDNFLQSRLCTDSNCGSRDLTEVRFCEDKTKACVPNVECKEWSSCKYDENINNIASGRISLGGYRTRVCEDYAGCMNDFIQQSLCEDYGNFQIIKLKECDEDFLVAIDPESLEQVSKISLGSLEENRLNIVASQNGILYCKNCYNGLKDGNEEGIDCGGSCKNCTVGRVSTENILSPFIWVSFGIFSFLFLKELKFNMSRFIKSKS